MAQNDGLIIGSMIGVVGIGIIDRFGVGKTPKPRVLVGGVIAAATLLIVNTRAPKVAVGLALISLMTAASLAVQEEIQTGTPSAFKRVTNYVGKDGEE